MGWIEGQEGLARIGHDGAGFAFDCEGPRHQILLHPHALADRLVTNGEWQSFIADSGYARPELWLADGWDWVRSNAIEAPLYWRRDGDGWARFGLDGLRSVAAAEPVCHISYYEADAYARWAGARLPTEGEWESAAAGDDPAQRQPARCGRRGAAAPGRRPLRRRLAMDDERLPALSRLHARGGHGRRI